MATSTIRTVDPTSTPISLSDLKDHLRIYDTTEFDSQLTNVLNAAILQVERATGRALITQTWEMRLDKFSKSIKVPHPPLQSVTSIQYQDVNDAQQTLGTSYYTVDTSSQPGRIVEAYNYSYPDTYSDIDAVLITFVAGYGDAEDVPEPLKFAIRFFAEKMWDNPDGTYGGALDNSLDAMITNYRIDGIAL